MLSELAYSAIAQFAPQGTSASSDTSRRHVNKLKRGDAEIIELLARRVAENISEFNDFFGPNVVLVPTPGHAPRLQDSAWIPLMLCEAMVKAGLGSSVEEFLVRRYPVKQSRFSQSSERPTAQVHYDSFAGSDERLFKPASIVLVDDVVSRGRTLLAGATRLSEAYPGVEVRGFAAFRTIGFGQEVEAIRKPFVGRVLLSQAGDAYRDD